MTLPKHEQAIKRARERLESQCDHPSIGEDCRRACLIGGMSAIGEMVTEFKLESPVKLGRLGIIVSPMEDCPRGFEEVVFRGGQNPRVKICRLDEDVRKKHAPKGKPAHKGALRRKKEYPSPGVIKRDIPGAKRRD